MISLSLHGLVLSAGMAAFAPPAATVPAAAVKVRLVGVPAQKSVSQSATASVAPRLHVDRQESEVAALPDPPVDADRPQAAPAPVVPAPAAGVVRDVSGGEREGASPPLAKADGSRDEAVANGVREYRVALGLRARRFRLYPPLARESGWEGEPEVVVQLGGISPAPVVALEKPSTHSVLDDQAVDTIRQAARATPIPDSLKGKTLRLVFKVSYSLADE